MLLEYFKQYIRVKGLSERTVDHYVNGLNVINALLEKYQFPISNIYEVTTVADLETIKIFLSENEEFRIKNSVGHNMYGASFNHFYKFVCGDVEFFSQHIEEMDIVTTKPEIVTVTSKQYRRNQIIVDQALEGAAYCCEHNRSHRTFIAKSTGHEYMEGHHLIPMKFQESFNCNLDVYANIVCLCPICHRQIHFGTNRDRSYLAEELYDKHSGRLLTSGIDLSKVEFLKLVM